MQIFKKVCTYCGMCCQEEVCTLGKTFCKTESAPCPAIETDECGKAWCGLIKTTKRWVFPELGLTEEQFEKVRSWFVEALGFGIGCDAKGEEMIYKFKAA